MLPKALEKFNYQFAYRSLASALTEEFESSNTGIENFGKCDNKLWKQNQNSMTETLPEPTYRLRSKSVVNRTKSEMFDFFSSPSNLGLVTPQWMNFKILGSHGSTIKNSEFLYQVKLGPLPLKWKSKIVHWEQDHEFVDLQIKGPYKLWWHHHKLTSQPDGTVLMEDTVLYKIPMGYIGRAMHKLLIKKVLKRIFNYRNRMIELRFTNFGILTKREPNDQRSFYSE